MKQREEIENDISELCSRGLGSPPVGTDHLAFVRFIKGLKTLVMTSVKEETLTADEMRIMSDHLTTIGANLRRLVDKMEDQKATRMTLITRIEDRHESWHAFDPNLFDGSQLRYPSSHIERLPVGSPAALLHLRVESAVRNAYKDLVADKKVKRYWETGDRDDWYERDLMSEILPAYIEAMDEKKDATNNNGFIIDIPDMLEAMITTTEFFTPEEPEREDDFKHKGHYFFKHLSERNALAFLRDKHLAVLRAIQAEIKK